jgi:hypothetical protein
MTAVLKETALVNYKVPYTHQIGDRSARYNTECLNWEWWYTPIIPALEFEAGGT